MGRRRAPRAQKHRREPLPSPRRIDVGADGYDYEVRPVTAANAQKTYRCPGCDHEVREWTAHVVVWPVDGFGDIDDRRHWHTPCWTNRATRRPTRRWS